MDILDPHMDDSTFARLLGIPYKKPLADFDNLSDEAVTLIHNTLDSENIVAISEVLSKGHSVTIRYRNKNNNEKMSNSPWKLSIVVHKNNSYILLMYNLVETYFRLPYYIMIAKRNIGDCILKGFPIKPLRPLLCQDSDLEEYVKRKRFFYTLSTQKISYSIKVDH